MELIVARGICPGLACNVVVKVLGVDGRSFGQKSALWGLKIKEFLRVEVR